MDIAEKAQGLSDLELATLLCLVAEQHCIIQAAHPDQLGPLAQELQLVAANCFGLSCAVLDCSDKTSLDDFSNGLLVEDDDPSYFTSTPGHYPEQDSFGGSPPEGHRTPRHRSPRSPLEVNLKIANVVVAKNLDCAHRQVQTQVLELIRGKRIFTRTAVYPVPKRFLFISLLASHSGANLTPHLNDHFFISHYHQTEDGLPNLEEYTGKRAVSDDSASLDSVIRPSSSPAAPFRPSFQMPLFPQADVEALSQRQMNARIASEVRAYLHNVVVFMRLHRGVAGGISALGTRHFLMLSKALAPLHGLDYVTPSLVALAARKIYPHRIILTTPENERSMQWGSDVEAVRQALEGVTVEDVIDEVLQQVEVPL
ncbi:uncharacterized protein K452DRAFT_255614 [Aplosporella prunicola CBS 121167]|uniref:magnesium chelatase n=1 Tax=Aplosporella prunicola CBS 121167 TaxID=1176127 RepID=A0A6A6B4K0_9PEZI|nr:uncharacterized protein K452DRAFT_255614 [Aplosporella prunicola CBS 121167]KAF2138766.1 hypothetical protein K452DRAFT_255614 [Aplosporella prunicola CBS 121167]